METFGDVPDDGEPDEQPEVEENEEILVPEQVLAHKVTKKGVIEGDYNVFKRGALPCKYKYVGWRPHSAEHLDADYVDLLLGEFKHYANRLAHADIPKEIREILLEFGVDNLAEVLVEAFSRAKRCTHEGRALMSLDLQILISGLRHLAPQRFASNLQVVEAYIKAYYLPETEYLHWVRSHPEYTKAQVISLINIVAYGHKWTRKLRADVLEKIEAGEY
ncbi:hypothetical protein L7F22_058530 [Adiantum nelumboides]|nr:hypothetical protein [Adiantum nelumboides]